MMDRRDFIKSITVLGCVSATSFVCGELSQSKKISDSNNNAADDKIAANIFMPWIDKVYEFSSPLPYNFDFIDEMAELNNSLNKSKIKTLYNSLPSNTKNNLCNFVESPVRGVNPAIKDFDDFAKYVVYAQKKGFDFCYALNSPKPFSQEDFEEYKDRLYALIENLKSINCYKVKVANTQLFEFFKEFPEFELSGSTSFEYSSIKQYQNLLKVYPNIKAFTVTIDQNKNFALLKNLKKMFPKVKFEIMVDEPCLSGCPARMSHPCSSMFVFPCNEIIRKAPWQYICNSNIIFPWQLHTYAKFGFNNFKLIGRGSKARINLENIKFAEVYLKSIENQNLDNELLQPLMDAMGFYTLFKDKSLVKDLKKYLPDIAYFIKNGSSCSEKCGVDCKYCYECAEKLKISGLIRKQLT